MYRHYVYELRDSTNTETENVFYVGKGVESRVNNHCVEVRRKLQSGDHESIKAGKEKQIADIILKSKTDQNDLQELIVGRFETEEQAFAVEATLIKWVYGKENLTNLVQGQHHFSIRDKGDFSFNNELNQENKKKLKKVKKKRKELSLDETAADLVVRLSRYGIQNLSESILKSDGSGFSLYWPVPESNFEVQIELRLDSGCVALLARPKCDVNYDEFILTMAEAGYLVTDSKQKHTKTGAFASLVQMDTAPQVQVLTHDEASILKSQHNYQGTWCSSYPDGLPKEREEEIVHWLQDFEMRVKIANISMDNTLDSQSKSELIDVLKLFNQRPEAMRKISDYEMAQQP